MMPSFCSICIYGMLLLIAATGSPVSAATAASSNHGPPGPFVFVQQQPAQAPLATLSAQTLSLLTTGNSSSMSPLVAPTLLQVLQTYAGATGQEVFVDAPNNNLVVHDADGHVHIRLQQLYQGNLTVVDAALVVHANKQGQVYAVNGEFVADGSVDTTELITCEQAFASVLTLPDYNNTSAVWLTASCEHKVVIDKYGTAHKAYERLIGYQPLDFVHESYHQDLVYASVVTGDIVAVRPQIHGGLGLLTENCHNAGTTSSCEVISNSSGVIITSDLSINDAHNYAIATYEFYKNNFGRDSIDGKGMPIVSHVHFGTAFNNAYWSGSDNSMTYGDGDGTLVDALSTRTYQLLLARTMSLTIPLFSPE
jgi:bacillolysin